MTRFNYFLLCFLNICCLSSVKSQSIIDLQTKLETYSSQHPQEKIHLHTDRNFYGAGETIWYKGYTVIDVENQLSLLSNLIHVELIDPRGVVIENKLHASINGLSTGDITLNDTLMDGSYRLRAYTNWMRNDSTDYFFEKVLQIGNLRTDELSTQTSLIESQGNQYYEIKVRNSNGGLLPKTSVRYEVFDNGSSIDDGRTTLQQDGSIRIKVNEKNRGKGIWISIRKPDNRLVRKFINAKSFFLENSAQAFPEGGHYLANQVNKIAFKLTNPKGKAISGKISIMSSSKDTVVQSQTNELGFCTSAIFMANDTQYTANVQFEDGSETTISLPIAQNSGYNLMVATNNNKIYSQVSLSKDKIDNSDIYIMFGHLARVYHIAKQAAKSESLLFVKNAADLPVGVITITILNKNLVPILERAYFNQGESKPQNFKVTTDKADYKTREKVTTNIELGAPGDSVRSASLSASVIMRDNLGELAGDQVNILSSLLLSGDLRGFIERPAYYFNEDGTYKLEDIDKLMLTQAWRKIIWKDIDSLDKKPEFAVEKSIGLSGYVRKIGRKAPVQNAKVQLISTTNFLDFIDTTANAEGYFEFENLVFPDSVKFLISASDQKGKKNVDISLQKTDPPAVNFDRNAPLLNNDNNMLLKDQLLASKSFFSELENKGLMDKTIQIEEVVIRASRPKAPDYSSNLNGPGNADQVLTEEDLKNCTSLEMCLNGRLVGVIFKNGVPYSMRGTGGPMLVVLDGMYMEGEILSSIIPQDVASIEVLKNSHYSVLYGPSGSNGVIVITTKRGGGIVNSKPVGLIVAQPKGLSVTREFYKPVYQGDSSNGFVNDKRTTIHWEPFILTDENGQAKFDFYTSDEPGNYRIVIEGVDLNGRLYRKLVDFSVK